MVALLGRRLLGILGSFHLAVTVLLLLLLLTFVGTLEQAERSLYEVQQDYFGSAFVVHRFGGSVPIALPGAYLLLSVLFVNLIVGGIVRIRKARATVGILIAHAGILLLLAGGFVEERWSAKGQVSLHEGEHATYFRSVTELEVVVREPLAEGRVREYRVPGEQFVRLDGEASTRVRHGGLPFDLVLSRFVGDAEVTRASPGVPGAPGGLLVRPLARTDDDTRVRPALTFQVVGGEGAHADEGGVLWLLSPPWIVERAGTLYEMELRRRRWALPFEVRLDRFVHEMHPGTGMARRFSSYVTRREDGVEREAHITMNEPLRHGGYTFYQSGYGPKNAPPGTPLYSTLSVVRNPSDQVPLIACLIVALGLLVHYGAGLVRVLAPLLLVGTLGVHGADLAHADEGPAPPEWSDDAMDAAAGIPLQAEGRVKPLLTWARFTLLGLNHKRSFEDTWGRERGALSLVLDALLRPESARGYEVFLVENREVVAALGLRDAGKKMRDRYSFAYLAPGRARLTALAHEYGMKKEKERTRVEAALVRLSHDLATFERLTEELAPFREPVDLPASPAVAALFGDRASAALTEVLRHAPALRAAWAEGDEAAGNVLAGAHRHGRRARLLAWFPPADPATADETWLTTADVVGLAVTEGALEGPHAEMLAALEALAQGAGDPEAVSGALRRFETPSVELAHARGEYERIGLELALHALDPFHRALVLYVLAFLVLAVSWMRRGAVWLPRIAVALTLGAFALHVAGIVMRCVLRSRPPVSTLYESILFVGAVVVLVALLIERANRRRLALALAPLLGAVLLFIAGRYELILGRDTMPRLVAVLDTNFWLATHVTAITTGYAAALLASALGHVGVLGRAFGFGGPGGAGFQSLGRTLHGVIGFGLVFALIGTVLGGIWANDSWGRFWGWDPKENGALMIVLGQLVILHSRLGGFIGGFGMAMSSVLLGCIVAFSWWGVNLLGVGLHSYGFASGVWTGLKVFYAVEAAVLLTGIAWWIRSRRSSTAA